MARTSAHDNSATIIFRDATVKDAVRIHGIYQHYVSTSIASLEEVPPILESIIKNLERLFCADMPCTIAEHTNTGKVVGYAYCDKFNERSGYRHTAQDSMYIHPDYTGQGIAKRLLLAVLHKLKASAFKVVIAKMSCGPEAVTADTPSGKLHMALGFYEVGRLRSVGSKFDRLVDMVLLQLDLDRLGS